MSSRPPKLAWGIAGLAVVLIGTLMVFAGPVCACTPVLASNSAAVSAGRVLRHVAAAQELYHDAERRYASDARVLGDSIVPRGWGMSVVSASKAAYAMRVTSDSGVTCDLRGERSATDSVLPFTINCSSRNRK